MDILKILSMFGGLALFLFGMGIMGEGLERRAGNNLRLILEKLTASPFRGFVLGLGVTAIIQSSSATTVMVVGFVNSGVMKLRQAIGVILGANVGTTITAWLLSLTGLEGDSLFVTLLKPSSFTPVLAVIGVILYLFSKNQRKKDTGTVLLGFAVLMYGMDAMSGAVKPLASDPAFTNLFLAFSNPILGILVGLVLTAIIQSSSASVGILQALSLTGAVTYGSALPIIMGQNIGTCATALLSSVGTNKNARRAALVHLMFNIIGVTIILSVFYLLNSILNFAFLQMTIGPIGIALLHTIFNLIATGCMLPFTSLLEKLAYVLIPESKDDNAVELLDERLLSTPTIAISQCRKLTVEMARMARTSFSSAMTLLDSFDAELARDITALEEQIDLYEDKLGSYLVKVSALSLTIEDSHEASKLLHMIGDFERIGDHAANMLKSAEEMNEKKIKFSSEATKELRVIENAVSEILDIAIKAFEHDDVALAGSIEPLEQVIDYLKNELRRRHVSRLTNGSCTIELGFVFSDILTDFERVADHCSNIGVALIEISHDSFDTHQYLNERKTSGDIAFVEQYNEYREKYMIGS